MIMENLFSLPSLAPTHKSNLSEGFSHLCQTLNSITQYHLCTTPWSFSLGHDLRFSKCGKWDFGSVPFRTWLTVFFFSCIQTSSQSCWTLGHVYLATSYAASEARQLCSRITSLFHPFVFFGLNNSLTIVCV